MQLARSAAARKITVLLSDCRTTELGPVGDPADVARRLDELVVIAPEGDDDEARAFAGAVGARGSSVAGPSDVVRALTAVLDA